MSVVVGIREKNRVLLAADSCVTASTQREIADLKLFQCSGVAMGGVGDLLFLQYVRYGVNVRPPGKMQLVEWCARRFAPLVREIYEKICAIEEDGTVGEFLCAHKGQMVTVTGRGEVVEVVRDFMAIGGEGVGFAMGSLHNSTGDAVKRAQRAIETAAVYVGDVTPPVRMVWT